MYAEAMPVRSRRSLAPPRPYLENPDPLDAFNRLEVGAVDDVGARRHGVGQSAYDGYVVGLQRDLTALGVLGPSDAGVFDDTVRDAVMALQWQARTGRRAARDERWRVAVTYRGAASGEVDAETRGEIRRWLARGDRLQRPALDRVALLEVLRFTVREETGGGLHPGSERRLDPKYHREEVRARPMAQQFLARDRRVGLRAGLLGWSQRSGGLGKLLGEVYAAEPGALPACLGARWQEILNGANDVSERRRMELDPGPDEGWARLLRAPAVEEAGLRLAWRELVRPLLAEAARWRLRTAKGLSFLVDAALTLGRDDALAAVEVCDERTLAHTARAHLAPALYALDKVCMGAGTPATARLRRLVADDRIDEVIEYHWDAAAPRVPGVDR